MIGVHSTTRLGGRAQQVQRCCALVLLAALTTLVRFLSRRTPPTANPPSSIPASAPSTRRTDPSVSRVSINGNSKQQAMVLAATCGHRDFVQKTCCSRLSRLPACQRIRVKNSLVRHGMIALEDPSRLTCRCSWRLLRLLAAERAPLTGIGTAVAADRPSLTSRLTVFVSIMDSQ
jgi:hypothetical protein